MATGTVQLRPEIIGKVQLRAAGGIIDDLKLRPGRAHRQVSTEGLDNGFLGCESSGQKAHVAAPVLPLIEFPRAEHTFGEPIAVSPVQAADPVHAGNIYAD